MLEQIGLTGLFNQKVKCENKLRKTRLSFPQASHCSDTFFLDSKLIFFSAALLPTTLCSAPGSYLPSSCQPAQTAAQHSQTQRSWSSKEICCCRQLGMVSEISGLPLTAPREPCNPSCAFSKGITVCPGWCYRAKEELGVEVVWKSSWFSISATLPAPQSVLEFTSIMSQPYQ